MCINIVIIVITLALPFVSSFYDGYKAVEMKLKTNEEMDFIVQLSEKYRADIWTGPSKVINTTIMIKPKIINEFLNILKNNNIPYRIAIKDVQKVIDKEGQKNSVKRSIKQFDPFNPIVTDHFSTYEEIMRWTMYLTEKYKIVSTAIYGRSYEGRDLRYVKISTGLNRKAVLADGGIHAREWLSVATLTYMLQKMIQDYTMGKPRIVALLSKYDFYFIPIFNPDGYAFSHTEGNRLWRKNRRPTYYNGQRHYGVDLNRNFNVSFGGSGSGFLPILDSYGGSHPFSEPETWSFSKFVSHLGQNMELYFSLHAYSQMWFVPYGFSKIPPPDDFEMRRVASIGERALHNVNHVSYIIGTPSELMYIASGSSYDWVKLKGGVKYSYTLEVRPGNVNNLFEDGFIPPITEIEKCGEEVYAGFIATAQAMRT